MFGSQKSSQFYASIGNFLCSPSREHLWAKNLRACSPLAVRKRLRAEHNCSRTVPLPLHRVAKMAGNGSKKPIFEPLCSARRVFWWAEHTCRSHICSPSRASESQNARRSWTVQVLQVQSELYGHVQLHLLRINFMCNIWILPSYS